MLGLSARDEFRPSGVQTDEFGLTHTHFRQYHQGVPVWGGMAITHLDRNGRGLAPTKDQVRAQVRVNTRPVVDEASAAALALLEVRPLGLPTQRPATELVIYPETKRTNLPKGKLPARLNAEDVREEVVRYRLAWHVHTVLDNTSDGVKHTDFLLDAHSGEVIRRWNSLETAAAVGTGLSQYSGQVQLDVFQNARGRYELRDTTRTYGEGLRTYDVNHADVQDGEPATPVLYEDDNNIWGDGENYNPASETTSDNGQTAAVDAHFGLQATWDYYQKIHGRFGIDNAGTPTFSRVHVSNAYDNAFWSDDCFCMSYGDGSFPAAGGFRSLVSLDVVAHELSHGVMHKTADLVYAGEPGGLNEANSDIFGTLTEFWVRNGQGNRIGDTGGNWVLGEDLSATPLRYMYKPSLDRYSKDAWSATLDSIDVHYSSGPMNRAFYFLSQGAQSTATANDYSSTYLPAGMTGIGNDKAAAIWYRAITVYLTPTSNYRAARTASLLSAADLHGTQSAEYRAVQNAFAAINVGYSASTYDDLTPPRATVSISGSAPTLSLSAVATDNTGVARVEYFVDNVPAGSSTLQPYTVALDSTLADTGTHQVVAKAYDLAGNIGTSSPVTFTVDNGFAQLLRNAGFEQGNLGWVEGALPNVNHPATGARTGQGYVWLNGYGSAIVDSVYQQVTLPSDAQSAALTFYLKVETQHTGATAEDKLEVQVRDANGQVLKTLATWSNLDASSLWTQRSFDLSEFAGRTVRIHLEGTEKSDSLATNFKLDDFSLRVITTADTTGPIVTASAQLTTTRVGLLAHVWDNGFVGAVEWLVDNQSVGTSTTSFEKVLSTATLGTGYHTLQVRAADKAGNTGTSSLVTFFIEPATLRNSSFEQADAIGDPLYWTFLSDDYWSNGLAADGYAHSGDVYMLFSNNYGGNTSTLSQSVSIPAGTQSAELSFWLWVESPWTTNTNSFTAAVKGANGQVLKTLGTFADLDSADDYEEHTYNLSEFAGQTIQIVFTAKTQTSDDSIYFSLD
ncbi:MAG: M4 family metallopeptidase, partial [Cystobacter sp.]